MLSGSSTEYHETNDVARQQWLSALALAADFSVVGPRASTARWMSIHAATAYRDQTYHTKLFVLTLRSEGALHQASDHESASHGPSRRCPFRCGSRLRRNSNLCLVPGALARTSCRRADRSREPFAVLVPSSPAALRFVPRLYAAKLGWETSWQGLFGVSALSRRAC